METHSFFSRKLTKPERKYPPYGRKLLAVFAAIRHFQYILEFREFSVLTDHQSLIHAFNQISDSAPKRRLRHLDFIAQYSTEIKYVKGTENVTADALSRINAIDMPTVLSAYKIMKHSKSDPELVDAVQSSSLNLQLLTVEPGCEIYCDINNNVIRPYIPATLRKAAFDSIHSLSHPGRRSTIKLLKEKYIWPGINKDRKLWARQCIACQRSKINRHNRLIPQHIRRSCLGRCAKSRYWESIFR